MFSVRLPVSSRLIVLKFWGSQKLYSDFLLCWGAQCPQFLVLFKDQLYFKQLQLEPLSHPSYLPLPSTPSEGTQQLKARWRRKEERAGGEGSPTSGTSQSSLSQEVRGNCNFESSLVYYCTGPSVLIPILCVLWVELLTTLLSESNPKDMGFALNFFQGRGRINLTRTNLQFGQWETKIKLLIALGFCLFRITVIYIKVSERYKMSVSNKHFWALTLRQSCQVMGTNGIKRTSLYLLFVFHELKIKNDLCSTQHFHMDSFFSDKDKFCFFVFVLSLTLIYYKACDL